MLPVGRAECYMSQDCDEALRLADGDFGIEVAISLSLGYAPFPTLVSCYFWSCSIELPGGG